MKGEIITLPLVAGHLVDVLSFVHIKKLTPAPALLFHAVVALAMVLAGDIEGLIDFFRCALLVREAAKKSPFL